MASSRLPGKILLPLGSGTVLAEVLRRAKAIEGVQVVCCAVSDDEASRPVAEEAARNGVVIVTGPQRDVLARYAMAGRAVGADVVMRVTSDCPLIDPEICGKVLALRRSEGVDYAANNFGRTWPHGLDCEAFTLAALERAEAVAVEEADREHVTPWLRRAPELRRANLEGPGGEASAQRWTLDYPEDYDFMKALFRRLAPDGPVPGMGEIISAISGSSEVGELQMRARRRAAQGIGS